MLVPLGEDRSISTSEDVVAVRQAVRQRAVDLGFNLVDQTKIVTAASELARNTLQYGGGGTLRIEEVLARIEARDFASSSRTTVLAFRTSNSR